MHGEIVEHVGERLRKAGMKFTRQRREVVELLLQARTHLSAEDLLERLRRRGRGTSRATVYRLVSVLRSCGVIDVHDFDQRKRVMEPMVGRVHHDHMYCIHCSKIIEFSNPEIERLQDEVLQRHGFQMIYHSHKIFGYCRACRKGMRG